MATKTCKVCKRSTGHYECPKCGCEYHLPCKKYPEYEKLWPIALKRKAQ